MKRGRLGEVLLSEGLRWRRQETWCGERVDSDIEQNRNVTGTEIYRIVDGTFVEEVRSKLTCSTCYSSTASSPGPGLETA